MRNQSSAKASLNKLVRESSVVLRMGKFDRGCRRKIKIKKKKERERKKKRVDKTKQQKSLITPIDAFVLSRIAIEGVDQPRASVHGNWKSEMKSFATASGVELREKRRRTVFVSVFLNPSISYIM